MSNTISHPGTMVIHPHNTCVADTAMMGAWGSERFTLFTVSPQNEAVMVTGELLFDWILNLEPRIFIHRLNFLGCHLFPNLSQFNFVSKLVLGEHLRLLIYSLHLWKVIKIESCKHFHVVHAQPFKRFIAFQVSKIFWQVAWVRRCCLQDAHDRHDAEIGEAEFDQSAGKSELRELKW